MANDKISGKALIRAIQNKTRYANATPRAPGPSVPDQINAEILRQIIALCEAQPELTYAQARKKILAEYRITHATAAVPKIPTRTATATDGTLGTPISNPPQTITRSTPSGTTTIPSYESRDLGLGYSTDKYSLQRRARAAEKQIRFQKCLQADAHTTRIENPLGGRPTYTSGAFVSGAGMISSRLPNDEEVDRIEAMPAQTPRHYQRSIAGVTSKNIAEFALENGLSYADAKKIMLGG